MNVRLANNSDEKKWDTFVQKQPGASPYHLIAWKKAVETAYGHKTYYLIAEENGQVSGVLPLVYFKLPVLSGYFVSTPFCDFGDALVSDDSAKEKLIMKAVLLAREKSAKYVELRGDVQQLSIQNKNLPVNTISHKVRMLLELPDSSEILWGSFKSKLRSQIRKAEKNDLVFKWGNINDLHDFYDVFSQNMLELGSPVHSKKWFYSILNYYGESARLGLMRHNDKPVGTGIILSNNNSITIPWASTLREYNRLSPNMLLYWNFLKYAADNGYKQFDFGRSTPDEGTYRFKAQWGAKPKSLYWHYIMINHCEFKKKDSSSSHRNKIANLWQKLPLGVANVIGPAIRKHISL
ncbi:femAB family protein [bacterium BMS3Abin15]|nr:femAB family protein [bacterium BMS3Abin15]